MDFIKIKHFGDALVIEWGDGSLDPLERKALVNSMAYAQDLIRNLYIDHKPLLNTKSKLYSGPLFGGWWLCPPILTQQVLLILEEAYAKMGSYPGVVRAIDPEVRALFFPRKIKAVVDTDGVKRIKKRLGKLAEHMRDVSLEIARTGYVLTDAKAVSHAGELYRAAEIVKGWYDQG